MMTNKVKKIYVIGHKNPDTDSVASAIAYAQLLTAKGQNARPLVPGKINKGTALALRIFGVKCPKHSHIVDFTDSGVVLVDHNEEGQWPSGVKKDKVIEVIDHHRVGEDFSTDHPIHIRIEPVGATSTIISKIYHDLDKKPEIHVAGLLLSAIITDTLMLKSPSTTREDRKMAQWLNRIVKINMKEHASEIFTANSDLTGLTIVDLIKKDFKEYHFNHETRMGIAMFETISPGELLEKREEIKEKMKQFKKKQKLDLLIFVIVDISRMLSFVIATSSREEETIEKIFKQKKDYGTFKLPGVVSRKTQLVPVFEKYFAKDI